MRKPSRIPSSENNVRESIARIDRKIKICGTDVVGQFDAVFIRRRHPEGPRFHQRSEGSRWHIAVEQEILGSV